ncbi:MAG: LamB/YcsF family protein, partial [Bacteroidia bacterium]|nr:LamB/YcsF family protein [Bacteroidia bacterium]
MNVIDLNCDMGEGIGSDETIMPFISSANIACGYHAGNEETIWQTIELAVKHNVSIGTHPSFLDRENFGRKEMSLTYEEIYELVTQQLILFDEIASDAATSISHIKPHGALYNMSVKKSSVAKAIANAVKDHSKHFILFGLSGSLSIKEAEKIGLKTASEVFADRTYQDDGSLTPRSFPGALIEDTGKAVKQVLQMIKENTVVTYSGKTLPILAETVCIHGDGKYAVELAKSIHET